MNPLYTRHFALKEFDEQEQDFLKNSTVMIIGCGGLGNLCSMYLATAGIGKLIVNDFDNVDVTNLQRQILYSKADIGQNKAQVTKQKLLELNPECKVHVIAERLNIDELLNVSKGVDLIIDCTDNFASRININLVSLKNKIPLLSGAAIRFEGQVIFFNPNDELSPCYQCFNNNQDETIENCSGNGIFAPVTGVIAATMATECLKFLTKITAIEFGRLQLYDARASKWQIVKLSKEPECPACAL